MMTNSEIDSEMQSLQTKRAELVLSKREHETKLIAIKNLIRSSGKMPNEKYKQCCASQSMHANGILFIENQLAPIKARIRELGDVEYRARQQINGDVNSQIEDSKKPMVEALVALRDEYQRFSADPTRVSSMRQMSAEFVLKLNPIIKTAVNGSHK